MRSTILCLFFIILCDISYSQSQVLISPNAEWKYFKGTIAPAPDMITWVTASFDDSQWLTGITPFWYGDITNGTELADMRYHYSTVFFRKKINISVPDSLIDGIQIIFSYDDGIRVYINDDVVLERNAPINNSFTDTATALIDNFSYDTVTITVSKGGLKNGLNVIAVEGYNITLGGSGDFNMDLRASLILKAIAPPKAPEVTFSVPGGYYTNAFNVALSSPDAGDTIKYTLDYTEPSTSKTAYAGKSPLTVNIDPSSSTGRPLTPAVVLRAAVIKSGFNASNSETRTYIFLKNVKTQSYPGGNWPNTNINSQIIDYNMDSRVVNDSRYVNSFGTVFSSIPTVSLVTDNMNLFDTLNGIYVNALNHGPTWERPASLEYINKANVEEFSVNAGVRIRGGWSRHEYNPKHAFRIFMRNDYGKKSLQYPLFGSDAAQDFDKFDLRCAQNYSWSFYNNTVMTYAQDEYCRKMQILMGYPCSHSSYCHLFLNGMYWGLFEFEERPEAHFGASYIGGKSENFDVIKVNIDQWQYDDEATDGNLDEWQKLYDITNIGFSNMEYYYKLQGLNTEGNVDTTIEALADIDNLIDYMINIFYSGNFDSPISEFRSNKDPNNFYAIKNRNHIREGFIFIVHDAEHTLNYIAGSEEWGNDGVNENRVSLEKEPYDYLRMIQPAFVKFEPQWLHYRLTENAEYCQRFADKAYKHFYNSGLFTPAIAESYFRNQANQINMAIIGESARWGDSRYGVVRTKDDDWIPAVNNTVELFIKKRTPIVIDQLKNEGLLNNLDAPVIITGGSPILTELYSISQQITVTLSSSGDSGIIYYTTDGSDPRLTGGSVSENAIGIKSGAGINIPYALKLKSRVMDDNIWSPLHEITFSTKNNTDKIRITEIQYNSKNYGSIEAKDLEYIELKNIGNTGIDMGGVKIDSAVQYTFPEGTIINPGGFVVLASDRNGFEFTYGRKPTGVYSGSLANEGEQIVITDSKNIIIIDMHYWPDYPWPIKANGSGYSMVSSVFNPEGNPAEAAYWKASVSRYGSPFHDDTIYNNVPEISGNSTFCNIFPNPVTDMVHIESTPFNPINTIQLYDLSGRLINEKTLINKSYISLSFSEKKINSGIYLLKVSTQKGDEIKKVIYMKK
jgi:hypothetical protein